jgi:hypothetical protein
MPTKRLTTRLERLAAQLAQPEEGSPLVVLLLGDRDPDSLTVEEKAALAWEQQGAVIGPQTKVVIFTTRPDGPQ